MTPTRRRAGRRAGAVFAFALATMGGGCASTAPRPDGEAPALAFVGADISALERIEQAGAVFRDAGTAGDAVAILRAHGSTGFRLRLFVNPNDSDVPTPCAWPAA
jgi:hypothetical protein